MYLLALLLLQPAVPPIPQTHVQRATKPVVIDGKIDEAVWQTAEPVTLQFPWTQQTGAKQKTVVRLLWDGDYLYVAYQCDDTDITVQFHNHDDPTYRDDAVELFVNPKPAQNFYYGLEMNAHAVLYDYAFIWPHMLLQRYDFTGVKLATSVTPKGWSLEVAIPWHNFEEIGGKMPPKPGDTWTANLNRWDGTEPNRRLSVWSDTLQAEPNPHNPARFGRLTFR
ncbi:MAG: carbohydrate-binding family 9-like protein [Bryobacteraceae bacterium]